MTAVLNPSLPKESDVIMTSQGKSYRYHSIHKRIEKLELVSPNCAPLGHEVPSAAKARGVFVGLCGTAKAVPYPEPIYELA